MIDGLQALGVAVEHDRRRRRSAFAAAAGGCRPTTADIPVGNSGTTVRFLTAVATLGQGQFRLDGTARMRQRPHRRPTRRPGATGRPMRPASWARGCPPVVVRAAGLPGGRATVAGDLSSQFLSALLMAAPAARTPVELAVAGKLVSKPYVDMTLAVMGAFGVAVGGRPASGGSPRAAYRACRYAIEPDASAASYFLAAAAMTGGAVTVEGLSRQSLQGDVAFCDCLEQMGCQVRGDAGGLTVVGGPLRGIEVDMNAISDTVPTLAVVALLARGPTTIRGVAHIRHKETDRIRALANELRKLGAAVEELDDGLRIIPGTLHGGRVGHLRRSPHGDEFGVGGPGHAGGRDSRPRLHGQDVSGVLSGTWPK